MVDLSNKTVTVMVDGIKEASKDIDVLQLNQRNKENILNNLDLIIQYATASKQLIENASKDTNKYHNLKEVLI